MPLLPLIPGVGMGGSPVSAGGVVVTPYYYTLLMGGEAMGLEKNVASQKWVVFAFNVNSNAAVTGDAANITGNLRLDGGAANAIDDTNPTELEDGYYIFDLSQAETNADNLVICPASSTANTQVIGVPGAQWTVPPQFNALDVATTNTAVGAVGSDGTGLTEAGGTGDHLSAIPWNAAWDAEVQSEVNDGLVALGLDHLVAVAVTGTDITDNSIVAYLVSSSATADWDSYVNTTDSMQAVRDRGDSAWITATGFSTHSATDVWAAGTRTLTAATNITSTGGTTVPQTGDSYARIGAPVGASISADIATVDGNVDTLITNVPDVISLANINAEVDTAWTTQMADSVATDNTISTREQAMYLMLQFLTDFTISSTTYTVRKVDGSTTLATFTLNDATSPTAITRAT